MAYISSR